LEGDGKLLADQMQDGWITDETRDALIASRERLEDAQNSSKPLMIIEDDRQIGHSFCLSKTSSTFRRTG